MDNTLDFTKDSPPFDASTLVLFCKRITADMLCEANEHLLTHKDDGRLDFPFRTAYDARLCDICCAGIGKSLWLSV